MFLRSVGARWLGRDCDPGLAPWAESMAPLEPGAVEFAERGREEVLLGSVGAG